MLRGDLERCLIVAPGGLVEQWQDELREKFGLTFELLTRQLADAEPDGNVFARHHLLIARMDQLSRSDDLKDQLDRRRLGPGGGRRGAPDVRALLRQRAEEDQALPARRAARPARAAPAADDRDPARGPGGGLPAVHGAAGHRPVRGPLPRRGAHGGHRRADAPHGQGRPQDVRGQAAVPRAPRLHRRLRAVPGREGPLRRGHPVRPRGDEPRRPAQAARRQQARLHRRLRADRAAAPARLQPRGDPQVAGTHAASAWRSAATRCATASPRRDGQRPGQTAQRDARPGPDR